MKTCPRCLQDLPLDDFGIARTRSDGRASYCKPCQREYRTAHYRSNPDPYKARAQSRKVEMRKRIEDFKSRPCMDCGTSYPSYVMDLDHRPDTKKLFDPSRAPNRGSWEQLEAELLKCDVVCSNCHRIRTHTRGYEQAGA